MVSSNINEITITYMYNALFDVLYNALFDVFLNKLFATVRLSSARAITLPRGAAGPKKTRETVVGSIYLAVKSFQSS